MVFEWDEVKDRSNQPKHSVTFETAAHVFLDPFAYYLQDRFVEDEERWQVIGEVQTDVLMVACVWISDETVRIISARRATPQERNLYYAHRPS